MGGRQGQHLDTWMWSLPIPATSNPRFRRSCVTLRNSCVPIRRPGSTGGGFDRLYDTLNAPYAERVRRQIRAALIRTGVDGGSVAAVIDLVPDWHSLLHLLPAPSLSSTSDDIHLICWMAIVPDAPNYRRANR